jgi:ComF family protein
MNFIDHIFPKQCINCEKHWEYLCKDCKKTLQPHPEICPYCHRFSENYKTCINCKTDHNNVLEGIITTFLYTWLLKKLILKFKYFHKHDIWDFLAERLTLAIKSNHKIPNQNLIFTSIPSHRFRKYFIKWYNQSEILAQNLSIKYWMTYKKLTNKTKRTKSQAWLNRNQRLTNLIGVFSNLQNEKLNWQETIIIVDDITTTWSTINELAKTIKQKYPHNKIRWLVLGRSNK